MDIKVFKTEQWMTLYENEAQYNLTDTCVLPMSFKELIDFDQNPGLDDTILSYGEIPGDYLLRKQICKLYKKADIDNIITTPGCLKANESVMMALLEKGDTVLTFVPGYQQFVDLPITLGCNVITLKYYEDNGWLPDFDEIKYCFSKHNIKMVIINSPNKPTGTFWNMNMLIELIELCRKNNSYILCDEVYRGLDIDQEHSVADMYEYGISTSSLSKVYSLPGLRLGWINANKEIIDDLLIWRDYSFISTGPLIDYLGLLALENRKKIIKRNTMIINKNKSIVEKFVKNNDAFELVMPKYGTVGFLKYNYDISSEKLAKCILDKYKVFFVPGSCFDEEYHLRLGFTNSTSTTSEGLLLLKQYLDETYST